MDHEQHRIFNLTEATDAMPWVRTRMLALRTLKHERDEAVRKLASMTPAMRANGHAVAGAELEARIDEIVERMQALLDEITERGVEVKDIDAGLVDFPALRQRRVIYLCWLIDEPRIEFWHEPTRVLLVGNHSTAPADPPLGDTLAVSVAA